MAQPPLLLCFQISQLLAFYQRTVSSMLGSRCQLADTLAATCKLARRVFAEQLKACGDKLLRYPPKPPQDLSPPTQVGLIFCCPRQSCCAHLPVLDLQLLYLLVAVG